MRLISADALHEALKTKQKWVVRCGDKHNEGYTYDQVHFAIDEAPTIDADRPQGYWTKTDVATYRCSECGKIQIADDVNELNYCCCCGSCNKMRRLKGADDE